jgi:competence protein ComEA
MWETIRGYLTFTRKERLGVLFLLLLISILLILPYFFKPSVGDAQPGAYEKIKDRIPKFETGAGDSLGKAAEYPRYTTRAGYSEKESAGKPEIQRADSLFYFDPNWIDAMGWQKLGLSERISKTILRYLEKGGKFKRGEDLQKIYGLSSADYERLRPFIRLTGHSLIIKSKPETEINDRHFLHALQQKDSFLGPGTRILPNPDKFLQSAKKFAETDINEADSITWSRLPGIGERLTSRILRFREKLGGFYQVDQVAETFGLPDSSFRKIKPWLKLSPVVLRTISLNSAGIEELQSHPYIRWQMARHIIEYRKQHGGFHSVDEALQLAVMDSTTFEKLKHYLTVKP